MIHGERVRRELRWDRKGLTGKLTLLVDWDNVDPILAWDLPHLGDAWPGIPFLRVIEVTMEEAEGGLCEITAYHSTERELGDEFYDVSISFGTESVELFRGWTWEDAGTPVVSAQPLLIPTLSYSLSIRLASEEWTLGTMPPKEQLILALGKVNSKRFHGFEAGHLRFDGANTDAAYNLDGVPISVNVRYNFTWRAIDHYAEPREPLQMRDLDGYPVFYQNIDENEPYYTEDASLIATPVYVEGKAGTAGWDRRQDGAGNYRYDACDFAAVLGLPKQLGDE